MPLQRSVFLTNLFDLVDSFVLENKLHAFIQHYAINVRIHLAVGIDRLDVYRLTIGYLQDFFISYFIWIFKISQARNQTQNNQC